MKTSNKLLTGFFIIIALIVIVVVVMMRVYYEGSQNKEYIPDLDRFKSEYKTEKSIESFNKINAGFYGRLYYIESPDNKIQLKSSHKSDLHEIEYRVKDNELIITMNDFISVNKFVEIKVYTPLVNEIKLYKGVRFETDNLNADICNCEITESVFQGVLNCSELYINGKDNAVINIEGSSEKLTITSSHKSVFNLTGFNANNVYVNAKGNSKINVQVKDSLKYNATSECEIRYSGNPVIINKNDIDNVTIQKINQIY